MEHILKCYVLMFEFFFSKSSTLSWLTHFSFHVIVTKSDAPYVYSVAKVCVPLGYHHNGNLHLNVKE